jgi:hypothetical protein
MPRDFQRSKVYQAEQDLPRGKEFQTLAGAQVYVNDVTRSRWWRKRVPFRYWWITLEEDPSQQSKKSGDTVYLYFDRRRRIILVPSTFVISEDDLLHELAHFMLRKGAGHGPEFVRHLIDLTRRFHSRPSRPRMMAERLVDKGVRVKPKKGR